MKRIGFYVLFGILLSAGLFCSCLSNNENQQWSAFNGVYVTVDGDNIRGYKLYTDFGAVLIPTTQSLNQTAWLKDVKRAIVSFNLVDNDKNAAQLEEGKTYDIILNGTDGMNRQIPTFVTSIDTLSEDYRENGKDSIALKNKKIYSFEKKAQAFYVKNGYMNVIPTFDYDPYKPVYFLLYYDGEKDIDLVNNKLFLHLYFNNSTQNPHSSISSFISLEMPGNIYYKFQDKGLDDKDSIDVYLSAETAAGNDQVNCRMALKDFMLP